MANKEGKSGTNDRLYFGGSKIIVDGNYNHAIKRLMLLRRKL